MHRTIATCEVCKTTAEGEFDSRVMNRYRLNFRQVSHPEEGAGALWPTLADMEIECCANCADLIVHRFNYPDTMKPRDENET